MNLLLRIVFSTVILLVVSINVFAQSYFLRRALREYNNMEYFKVCSDLNRYFRNNPKDQSCDLFLVMADSYWKMGQYQKAAPYYFKIAQSSQHLTDTIRYRLSRLEAMNGNYLTAVCYLHGIHQYDEIANGFLNVESMLKDSLDYAVFRVNINSQSFSEYSPLIIGTCLFWTTNQPRKTLIPKVFGWSGQQYDYIREIRDIRNVIPLSNADIQSGKGRGYKERNLAPDFEGSDKSVLSKPDQLSVSARHETFNKWNHPLTEAMVVTGRRPKFNMATMSYSPVTHKAYFTVNLPVSKRHHSAETKRLGIAEAEFYNGYCQHLHYLYLDTGTYNMMHPAISPDGQILVFSSNRPGGKGGFDLYYAVKDSSSWGKIHALDAVNTSGNEVFPNFTSDGTLYFSSDGRQGLGGLDIYKVKLDIMHGDNIVKHLGYPINGAYDDFGWTEEAKGSFGFFSSNRNGSDDIYSFKKEFPQMMLSGVVLRKTDSLMFSGVGIRLFVNDGQYWNTVGHSITRQGGHFQFVIKPGKSYMLQMSFNGVSLMKTVDSPSVLKNINLGKIYLKNPN